VYRRLQFDERSQQFVGSHDETSSVLALCANPKLLDSIWLVSMTEAQAVR